VIMTVPSCARSRAGRVIVIWPTAGFGAGVVRARPGVGWVCRSGCGPALSWLAWANSIAGPPALPGERFRVSVVAGAGAPERFRVSVAAAPAASGLRRGPDTGSRVREPAFSLDHPSGCSLAMSATRSSP
jgi:hypothetical protein